MLKNRPGITEPIVALTVYKGISLFSGTLFGFMGYKLFMAGVFEKAGQLEGTFGKEHLLLKEAAPGTFFALFGCLIILYTLMRGFKIETPSGTAGRAVANIAVAAAPAAVAAAAAKLPPGRLPD